MKKILVCTDTRNLKKMVACDISTPELRALGYLSMFQLLQKNGGLEFEQDAVEAQLYNQACNGNAKAAMAYLLLSPPGSLEEVDVEEPPKERKTVRVDCPEALADVPEGVQTA